MKKLIVSTLLLTSFILTTGCTTTSKAINAGQTIQTKPVHIYTPEEQALLDANKAKMLQQQQRGDKFVQ